ncbi:cysteine-rich secretory protein 3-like [Myotis lucifugus]|uniref:cysteine-rich secretory protein 3-like n=1 Tax=Myotis lucifugus TaxID=59463 RepID=UPI0006D736CB|nr:cysteine-rich secretory protein 3-like [Myotis lucifugus]
MTFFGKQSNPQYCIVAKDASDCESNTSILDILTQRPSVQMEIINKHNDLRRMASPSASNMLKMTWNDVVARNAASWATKCTLSHSPSYARQISSTGCGENLYMSSSPKSWSDAIQSLYDEVKDFKYGYGGTRANAVTGHYTQLVWATSHQLGCALAHCPHSNLQYYYVCHYCPAGNHYNTIRTPYKRGRPCQDCPNHCDNGLCTNSCMKADKITNCDYLVRKVGCNDKITRAKCQATCQCPSSIK